MKVKKVVLESEDFLTDLEIEGSCSKKEIKILEQMAKRKAYFLGFLGQSGLDFYGNRFYKSLLAEAKLSYSRSKNPSDEEVEFNLSYTGTRINKFWNDFQKKFGQVDESKLVYE